MYRSLLLGLMLVADNVSAADSDKEIKQIIIQQSIAQYPGICPCPYSIGRDGISCGTRSAWSREDGYAPICFEGDVTQSMVDQYKFSR